MKTYDIKRVPPARVKSEYFNYSDIHDFLSLINVFTLSEKTLENIKILFKIEYHKNDIEVYERQKQEEILSLIENSLHNKIPQYDKIIWDIVEDMIGYQGNGFEPYTFRPYDFEAVRHGPINLGTSLMILFMKKIARLHREDRISNRSSNAVAIGIFSEDKKCESTFCVIWSDSEDNKHRKLECFISYKNEQIHLDGSELFLSRLPETVVSMLPGRMISEVVDFLPDCRIWQSYNDERGNEGTFIYLETEKSRAFTSEDIAKYRC